MELNEPTTDHAGTAWTDDDLALLVTLYAAGRRCRDIAKDLGRTTGTVFSKLRHLRAAGVKLPIRKNRGINVEALNQLIAAGE